MKFLPGYFFLEKIPIKKHNIYLASSVKRLSFALAGAFYSENILLHDKNHFAHLVHIKDKISLINKTNSIEL